MGIKGKRTPKIGCIPAEPTLDTPEWRKPRKKPKKTTKENSEHRRLCELGAEWLHKGPTHSWKIQKCPFVAVELVSVIQEIPDIFGWDYWSTTLIEVKVSRQDFLKDSKKAFREHPEQGIGMKRAYLCPEGLITPDEIPEKWGLLYESDNRINVIVEPELFETRDMASESKIYASVFRRCGVRPQVLDFRRLVPKVKYVPEENEVMLKWSKGTPREAGCYLVTVRSDGMSYVTDEYWDGDIWSKHRKKDIIGWIRKKDITPCPDSSKKEEA